MADASRLAAVRQLEQLGAWHDYLSPCGPDARASRTMPPSPRVSKPWSLSPPVRASYIFVPDTVRPPPPDQAWSASMSSGRWKAASVGAIDVRGRLSCPTGSR